MIKVRFAPSPTGKLHIGNIRIAVMNWLFAKSNDGHFMLRIDDTDTERSTKQFEDGIINDMQWLGLSYDSFMRQNERIHRYDEIVKYLKSINRLYPCYETTEELNLKRKLQQSQGKPPVYDRSALNLTDEQKKQYEQQNKKPHWRFKLDDTAVQWNDLSHGETCFKYGHLSDPVVIREDGRYLYTITSVVDDIDMNISHIIRGEDHITNTATQIQLFELLSNKIPKFAHMPLITNKDGKGFSKRLGSGSIQELREQNIESITILSVLARLGTSVMTDGTDNLEKLKSVFDIKKFGRATPKFNSEELFKLNAKFMHNLSYKEVKSSLPNNITEELWNAIHKNIDNVSDCENWINILTKDIQPIIEDKQFINKALELLPDGDINDKTWNQWIKSIKNSTSKKGKELFMPLRLALTGLQSGPEMSKIFHLISRKQIEKRLNTKC